MRYCETVMTAGHVECLQKVTVELNVPPQFAIEFAPLLLEEDDVLLLRILIERGELSLKGNRLIIIYTAVGVVYNSQLRTFQLDGKSYAPKSLRVTAVETRIIPLNAYCPEGEVNLRCALAWALIAKIRALA